MSESSIPLLAADHKVDVHRGADWGNNYWNTFTYVTDAARGRRAANWMQDCVQLGKRRHYAGLADFKGFYLHGGSQSLTKNVARDPAGK